MRPTPSMTGIGCGWLQRKTKKRNEFERIEHLGKQKKIKQKHMALTLHWVVSRVSVECAGCLVLHRRLSRVVHPAHDLLPHSVT